MKHHLLIAIASLALAGCIHSTKTVYRDEPRLPIEFENDTAARVFYEALSKSAPSGNRSESNTEVSLPIIFEHKERVVQGESLAFNNAVLRCDTNHDGHITEAEARIFAAQATKP
jgi:hypothetical protein